MKWMLFAVMVLFCGIFVGCGETEEAGTSDSEVKIGVILPLSGNNANYGADVKNGVELRVDEINAAGGIDGKQIKLIFFDNKGLPDETDKGYAKLVGSDKVSVVIGPITSDNTIRVRQMAMRQRVPVISPTATRDNVTLENPYVFRACFSDSFQGRVLAQYAVKDRGYKKAAILTELGNGYSEGISAQFKAYFERLGGSVVAGEMYNSADQTFDVQLAKIAQSQPEMLFLTGYDKQLQLQIIASAAIPDVTLAGADNWSQDKIINDTGDRVAGSFMVGAFSKNEDREEVKAYLAAYEAKFPDAPVGGFDVLGYDAVSMIEAAIKAEGTKPDQITKGLGQIKDLKGVSGNITMTPEGDAIKSAVIMEIVKNDEGKMEQRLIKRVAP